LAVGVSASVTAVYAAEKPQIGYNKVREDIKTVLDRCARDQPNTEQVPL
jgi:hypothetical protein